MGLRTGDLGTDGEESVITSRGASWGSRFPCDTASSRVTAHSDVTNAARRFNKWSVLLSGGITLPGADQHSSIEKSPDGPLNRFFRGIQ